MRIAKEYICNEPYEKIVIAQYPNGKYYNHCRWDEKRKEGACVAGGFETLEQAENMVKKHRPTAKASEKNYIGNARIINDLLELPKVGYQHGLLSDSIVVSVEMQDEMQEGYIIYKVKYLDGKFIDTDSDIYCFSYAIKPENIK